MLRREFVCPETTKQKIDTKRTKERIVVVPAEYGIIVHAAKNSITVAVWFLLIIVEEFDRLLDDLIPKLVEESKSEGVDALEGLNQLNWYFEWLNYTNSGVDADVRIPADHLIQVLLRTPEFQIL